LGARHLYDIPRPKDTAKITGQASDEKVELTTLYSKIMALDGIYSLLEKSPAYTTLIPASYSISSTVSSGNSSKIQKLGQPKGIDSVPLEILSS
jgi:hypothetical protein